MRALFFAVALSFALCANGEPFPTNAFPQRLETKYFRFYFHSNPKELAEIFRFADAYIDWLKQNYFDPKFKYPIGVVIMKDHAEMQHYLKTELGVKDPPDFGIYFSDYRTFFTRQDSGLGTFAHEILHPLVDANLPRRPPWANEGIPTFFEKFYGYYQGTNLVLSVGYQNPWRIQALGENLPRLDLQEIVSRDNIYKWTESDLRLVAIFLWQQGKFRRFIELIQSGDKLGKPSYFEAALEKNISEILPDWRRYTAQTYARRELILKLPPSRVLPNRTAYDQFVTYYGLTNFLTHAQLYPADK